LSYSYIVGQAWFPVTGGLFLGDDAVIPTTGHLPDSQDQRNTVRGRVRYQVAPRFWIAGGIQFDSGLPFEFDGDSSTALAEYGRRVLLVYLDPQGALSAGLGVPHYELEHTIHNLLVEPRVSLDNVLMHTRVKNLDLVPSNIDLSAAEIQLVNEVGREQTLSRALHPVLDRYDYVLIDCQPSLGLLTVNGLACSDGVIIPTECEFFSLRGLALLTDTVDKVRDRLNPKLDISGILITRYDPRTVNSREVMARVVQRFGDLVFDTVISRTVRFPETTVAGEPITSWAPKSGGAAAYRSLAREVIDRFGA